MKKIFAVLMAAMLVLSSMVFPSMAETGIDDAATLDEALNYADGNLHFVSEGDYPWVIEGDHAKSSNQGVDTEYDYETGETYESISSVSTTVTVEEGTILAFEFAVSSEDRMDRLRFFVDGERIEQWSGEIGWTGYVYELSEGTHEIEWLYRKDSSGADGLDTAWLDNIHVGEEITVEGVEITNGPISVPACRKVELKYNVLPLIASNKNVLFDSADESIAYVDDNGYVRGVSEGTTTISVCTEDGGFIDSCEVTVTEAQPAVQLYGLLCAESLYYSYGSGSYRQPCVWATFNDVDPETSLVEYSKQLDSSGEESAVAAAEYVDGYVYGFLGFGYAPEEFFRMSFEDLQNGVINPEYYGTSGSDTNMILDMAYNYANETMYYLSMNLMTDNVELYTVDLVSGESTLIGIVTTSDATVNMPFYYSLAIGTDGTGYVMLAGMGAINYGSGMLCEINLETAEIVRNIGATGAECFQQQSMTYDHVNDVIYWAQWSNAYSPGNELRVVNPETGASESCGAINGDGGCEILGLFIPYDNDDTPVGIIGDVNGDGNVDISDATIVLRYALGISTIPEQYLDNADVNGDGQINVTDATLIIRMEMGIN